jgi:formiminoglutamase
MGRFFWKDDVTPGLIGVAYAQDADAMLVTFDLDAVDQSAAPGVSAPTVGGLDPSLWLKAAYEAGRCPRVTSIDLVEYNPAYDVDRRTARLAALTVWHILRGLAERFTPSLPLPT